MKRVAVSGTRGRLGHAIVAHVETAFPGDMAAIPWSRPDFDLDRPAGIAALLDRDRPDVVVHAAAWTDVDACAREPDLALARNGTATAALAAACAQRDVDLVYVSTNEVFDGAPPERRGYRPADEVRPINPYGASKAAGERGAVAAFADARSTRARVDVVRTAWLYGPPGADFPAKILAAARRASEAGTPLRAVADEFGSPTYASDLADAIVRLVRAGISGTVHHVVNAGVASRADWARAVLAASGLVVAVEEVPASTWQRASAPPQWGVLEPTPLPGGILRPWNEAFDSYARAMALSAASEVRA